MTHIDIGEKKRNRASIELKKWAERLRKQRRSPSEQIKRSKSAAATIHQSFEAIHQIFYQSSEPPPEIRVRERRFVFTIDKTGDCRCVETRWQTVINQHHSMELIPVAGTSDVLGFDSLKEKAVLRGCGSSTVVVPALDDLREKRFLVYFVPAIPKGEEHELEISWTWPKMWKPLVAGRPDSWLVRPSSTWEIQRLLLVFDLERGLPDIVLRNVGQGGGKPVEEADIIPGRTGSKRFAWEIKSLRPGATVVMKLEPQTG